MFGNKLFLETKLWRGCCLLTNRSLTRNISSSANSSDVVPLAYKIHSEFHNETAVKPPVIVLHGAMGSKTNWNSLSKAISKYCQRKVIAIDARGHGESPHHAKLDYISQGDDLLHFLKTHGHQKAILIGHSMGGRAAMAAALKQPQIVEKLVVVDVSPVDSRDPHALPDTLQQLFELRIHSTLPLAQARQQADRDLSQFLTDRVLRQFLLSNLILDSTTGKVRWQFDIEGLANNAHHIRAFPIEKFEGKSYVGPTLFVGGSLSRYLRLEDFPTIRKYFPNAEFNFVAGAGHWVHSERPQEFLQVVSTFIANLTAF
ncbi:hypothetical protein CHUAL_005797 [Chamberlinius hualienensis]